MHHLDAYKTHGEKARWDFLKNVTCWFEQILEAAIHKTAHVCPLTPISQTIQDEQDMLGSADKVRTISLAMISYGLLHMDTPVLANQ